MPNKPLSDKAIIEGLIKDNKDVLNHIYRVHFKHVKNMVKFHGGTLDDAQDVFQEGLIAILKHAKAQKLIIIKSFNDYFIATCRNKWFEELNRRNKTSHTSASYMEKILEGYKEEKNNNFGKLLDIFKRKIQKLKKDCQQILDLFYVQKLSMNDIMSVMGYASVNFAKLKKFRCMKYLENSITKDPKFKELNDA